MSSVPEIFRAISSLYTIFARVPKPAHLDGCPCCLDEKDIDILLTKPLRELTPDELSPYAASVFLTVGSEDDFRYFLPRILEIAATDCGWWPDWEVIGRSLASGRWLEWIDKEKAVVLTLLEAEFAEKCKEKNVRGDGLDGSAIDGFLCCLSLAGLDISPYLKRLAANSEAVLALYGWHANEIRSRTLANGFWSDAPKGAAELVSWFYSQEISRTILEAYGVDLNPPANNASS